MCSNYNKTDLACQYLIICINKKLVVYLGQMNKLLLVVFLFIVSPQVVKANQIKVSNNGSSDVSINQKVEGESTTCINGKCTTTGGSSNTKVCVNGECYESKDGSISVESKDGNTKVNINNSDESNTVIEDDEDEEEESLENVIEGDNNEKKTIIQVVITVVSDIISKIFALF